MITFEEAGGIAKEVQPRLEKTGLRVSGFGQSQLIVPVKGGDALDQDAEGEVSLSFIWVISA